VHGGGRRVTELGHKLGIESRLVGGRRITDAPNLELAVMVYGGLVNKGIVARLQGLSCNAIGLSGADGNAIYAHKRPVKEIDFGLVGDVDGINPDTVSSLLNAGFTPVFCALTHDGKGQLLNTNADTIASEMAIGMSQQYETTLYYCFEKKGVLRDKEVESSVIRHIDQKSYAELLQNKIIDEGMLPKMENCFHALHQNVYRVCIGDTSMLQPCAEMFTTITL
jgi:acetylglutamate kinase